MLNSTFLNMNFKVLRNNICIRILWIRIRIRTVWSDLELDPLKRSDPFGFRFGFGSPALKLLTNIFWSSSLWCTTEPLWQTKKFINYKYLDVWWGGFVWDRESWPNAAVFSSVEPNWMTAERAWASLSVCSVYKAWPELTCIKYVFLLTGCVL